MPSKASTVAAYLAEQTPERAASLQAVREVILASVDAGIEEGMQYGMIGYYIPHRVFPGGYHCDPKQPLPYAALAAQKNHLALYLCAAGCAAPEWVAWFESAWKSAGYKLDMGKSCVRFKSVAQVPLEVVAQAIRRVPSDQYVRDYLAGRG